MNQRMGEIVKTAVATNKRRKGIIANTEHKHNGMVWYGRATKLMLCVQQYSAYFSRTDVVGWKKKQRNAGLGATTRTTKLETVLSDLYTDKYAISRPEIDPLKWSISCVITAMPKPHFALLLEVHVKHLGSQLLAPKCSKLDNHLNTPRCC